MNSLFTAGPVLQISELQLSLRYEIYYAIQMSNYGKAFQDEHVFV